jgi:chromosome partitioning protein
MGRVVTVMNMKGGVGKSTVAAHLGGFLAMYEIGGRRRSVLLVDYDPQFNLSQMWLPSPVYVSLEKARKTILSVLLDDPTKLNPYELQVPTNATPPSVDTIAHPIYVKSKFREILQIVPSTLDLMYVALAEPDQKTDTMEKRFKTFIAEARQKFDVVLIDCHPAGSLFTKTALRNSSHVLIPVVPERFSLRGVGLMMRFIKNKAVGATSPIPHILFNRMPTRGVTHEERTIRGDSLYTGTCIQETLKEFKAFTDPTEGSGFVWFSRKPHSTRAFKNLHAVTAETVGRMGL